MELRDYQLQAVADIFKAWEDGARRVMFQLPTGGGKTEIGLQTIHDFPTRAAQLPGFALTARSHPWFVVHRKELLKQTNARIRKANVPAVEQMIQTLSSSVKAGRYIPEPPLIILDEAHHACSDMYDRVTAACPNSRILGLSATPSRLDGRGLNDHFDVLIQGPTMQDLILDNWLSEPEVIIPKRFLNETLDKLSGMASKYGDFTKAAAMGFWEENEKKQYGNVLDICDEHWFNSRAIIFCVSVEHCYIMEKILNDHKFPCAVMEGKTPDQDRDRYTEKFKSGELRGLISCDLINEGFDVPACDTAVMLRPTQSYNLYMQSAGRAIRNPRAPLPNKCKIIDHVGNVHVHGEPWVPREWTLQGRAKFKKQSVSLSMGFITSVSQSRYEKLIEEDADFATLTMQSSFKSELQRAVAKKPFKTLIRLCEKILEYTKTTNTPEQYAEILVAHWLQKMGITGVVTAMNLTQHLQVDEDHETFIRRQLGRRIRVVE